MSELLIRSISGLLYVALIIFSAYWSNGALLIIIFIFSSLALFEFQKLINYKSPISFLVFGILSYQFFNDQVHKVFHFSLLALTLITLLYLTYCLIKEKKFPSKQYQRGGISFFYIVGSGYFILATTKLPGLENNFTTLLMYTFIWTNNCFAYIFGKRLGKKLFFPSISPNKTWEGFWGGGLSCLGLGFVLMFFNTGLEKWIFPVLAIVIISTATVGDLIQSKFKREAKVKDSGSLIPGHGGFFDRMDSVLYTAPFVYLVLILSEYVP
jgi:phosphatidate cytidylyltransferase